MNDSLPKIGNTAPLSDKGLNDIILELQRLQIENKSLKEEVVKITDDRTAIVNMIAGLLGKRYTEIPLDSLKSFKPNGDAAVMPSDWNGVASAVQCTKVFVEHLKKYGISPKDKSGFYAA